jgi:hypothetical protein
MSFSAVYYEKFQAYRKLKGKQTNKKIQKEWGCGSSKSACLASALLSSNPCTLKNKTKPKKQKVEGIFHCTVETTTWILQPTFYCICFPTYCPFIHCQVILGVCILKSIGVISIRYPSSKALSQGSPFLEISCICIAQSEF